MRKTTDVARQNFRFCGGLWQLAWALILAFKLAGAQAEPLKLLSVDFTTLPGDSLQVQMALSGPAFSPRVFHTDNPARIALDLPGVSSDLDKKPIPVNVGNAESIQAIAAGGRTRVVINLTELPPYSTRVEGNNIYVVLRKGRVPVVAETPVLGTPVARASSRTAGGGYAGGAGIRNIDFRRGDKGVGRILVTLGDPKTLADIREEGSRVIARFPGASLPPTLARRLDVMDFATPVQFIDSLDEQGGAKLIITPTSEEYDYSSYQTDNQLTIEFRPLTKAEKEEIKKKSFAYGGEKLSLNFQDIPVRSVLQILGDFTNLNIVASDTVGGNVTLRLNDVPWDQALDLVLKAKNLGKRQEGNIIQILPMDELNSQTKADLEALKVVEDLEPLKTEIIQINYTNASAIKEVLLSTTKKTVESDSQQQSTSAYGSRDAASSYNATTKLDLRQSILSERGNVTVDDRTNQLIVKDTAQNLERVRDLVKQLDKPVRQVLIESRIVIANSDFSRELGSRFSLNQNLSISNTRSPRSQLKSTDSDPYATDPATTSLTPAVDGGNFFTSGNALSSLPINAAVAGPGGVLGVTILQVGDYLLDLELSAAQREGRGEILSNPRLITADQTEASIMQGQQLPYTTGATATTVANIQFKNAVLELRVTPHITPDDNVRMEINITRDTKGEAVGSNFAIDKREITTTAQVSNGETVVLGGVYEGTKTSSTEKVPFFGDLPGVGFMFRHNSVVDQKKELLIFITPKILKQNLGQR